MELNTTLTLGSLFDGSGGFPLGGLLAGITPVWASEIEPFPIRVTTKRLPFMKHYGDISQMDGGKIEPVDIITFGSPCTDMSIAGRRAGLDGKQSGLFYQAIRIIQEMREATHGRYPRYIVWENVPGAFSSNKGEDFKAVLEAVIGIKEPGAQVPMPEKNLWPYADLYMGEQWSVAYRTLDAQHWGVPQRRRRIFLVADFAGWGAGQVLFESEGLSGYSAEGFRAWQRAAGDSAVGVGAAGFDGYNGQLTGSVSSCLGVNCGMSTGRNGIVLNDQGGDRMDITDEVTCTLRAKAHHPPCVMESAGFCTEHSATSRGIGFEQECAPTLRAGVVPAAIALESHPIDSRIKIADDQTLFEPVPFGICSDQSKAMLSDNPHAGIYKARTSRTLDTGGGNPGCNQGGIAVVTREKSYARTMNSYVQIEEEKKPALLSRDYKDPTAVVFGIGRDVLESGKNAKFTPSVSKEVQPTLVAKGPGAIVKNTSTYTVRRLTPTECARLQGFPDWWCTGLDTPEPTGEDIAFWIEVWETHRRLCNPGVKPKTERQIVKWLRNPHSDAAEYKMWGNGVALPNVYFVLSGIVWALKNEETA